MLKKMFIALTFFLYIQERKKRNFIWERCTVSKHGEGINDFVNRIVIQDMVLWKSSIKKWYYEQYYECSICSVLLVDILNSFCLHRGIQGI